MTFAFRHGVSALGGAGAAGSVQSAGQVKELTAAIGAFIDAYNDRCQPFAWTKDADELLTKVRPSKN